MPWISAFSSKIVCHQWHPTASRKGQETLLLHRWFRCPGASDNQWWTNGESMANQWWLVHNGEYLWNIYGISMIHLLNIMIFMWQTQWINCIKRIILYPSDDDPPKKTRQWPNNVAENLWLASFCRTSGCGGITAAPLADCWEVSPYEWPDDTDCVWFFTLVFTLVFFPSWQYFTSTI